MSIYGDAIMKKLVESILASPLRSITIGAALMMQLAILLELFAMNKNLREINEQIYSTEYLLGQFRDQLAPRR